VHPDSFTSNFKLTVFGGSASVGFSPGEMLTLPDAPVHETEYFEPLTLMSGPAPDGRDTLVTAAARPVALPGKDMRTVLLSSPAARTGSNEK